MQEVIIRLRRDLKEIEDALSASGVRGADLSKAKAKAHITLDYKAQRAKYFMNRFSHAIISAKSCVKELEEQHKSMIMTQSNVSAMKELVARFETECNDSHFSNAEKTLKDMKSLLPKVDMQTTEKIAYDIPALPNAIMLEVTEDLSELKRCLDANCLRSAIILCGRILETILHRKYYEHTNNDLLETSPGIGLGKIIAKMSDAKISLPVGLNEQIHLINNVRIMSVHKKKRIFAPSKGQTQAIVLFTLDTVRTLFSGK
ncbi:hypothetical protein COV93_08070 [Candidatus Woesearchaeota archaeon CG11_big_fil_rev_8_21_14_0_20_43_8]|nr:MAG: hypothetical protein COV93_08070 [Candidatus Woesearchaeota archaeon CG11_big_fil_rev_8_21_14_0_20_43_8]